MRVILQRVRSSTVTVDGETIGAIDRGFNLLVGIAATDTDEELAWMARKCLSLRLFPDTSVPNGRFDRSIADIGGDILVVSQFTLYGDCRKGRRPNFDRAAAPSHAEALYNRFVEHLQTSGLKVETGRFGARMQVDIQNDGPVTLMLEREAPGETS